MPKPIIIVQGGQYGSEAKGAVAAFLCREHNVKFACRTGAVNAGHTVYRDGSDFPYKMQQLPTGWAVDVPYLIVGPGALVHPGILSRELDILAANGYKGEIIVDSRAGLHTEEHTRRSSQSGRHYSMGATGKGCSEALCARIMSRGKGNGYLLRDYKFNRTGFAFGDTVGAVNTAYDDGAQILLEGTQGSLLDLYLGPYPYVTHKPTQAATWIQEMGLSPRLRYEIVMVLRTFPIRVAGNSGPLPKETAWRDLAWLINSRLTHNGMDPLVKYSALAEWGSAVTETMVKREMGTDAPDAPIEKWTQFQREQNPELVSELHRDAFDMLPANTQAELRKLFEFTTVTNKLRRIAGFDADSVRHAIMWNRPDYIVLTFLNYLFPEARNTTSWDQWPKSSQVEAQYYVHDLEKRLGVEIRYVSTGPRTEHILRVL